MTTLNQVTKYVQAGFSIIPLCRVLGNVEQSKRPAIRSWKEYQTRRATQAEVSHWFGNGSGPCNVALLTGKISGNVVALDFDQPEMYKRWVADYPQIAEATAIAKTGKGHHVLLRLATPPPGNYAPAFFQGKPIGETRGEGGYIVVWPSIHGNGTPYEWIRPPWEGIAEVESLESVGITKKDVPQGSSNPAPAPSIRGNSKNAYADAAFSDELQKLASAVEGNRNTQLNASAFALGQLIAAGELARSTVERALQDTALAIGLTESEICATMKSGIEAGMKQPRQIPEREVPNGYHPSENFPGEDQTAEPDEVAADPESILQTAINAKKMDEDYTNLLNELAIALVDAGPLKLEGYVDRVRGAGLATKGVFADAVRTARKEKQAQERANQPITRLDESPTWPYAQKDGKTIFYRQRPDGLVTPVVVCEFAAQITAEITAEDGTRHFRIEGQTVQGRPFSFDIPSRDFAQPQLLKAALTQQAGARAPISARMESHLAPAIQKFADDDLVQIRRFDRIGWHSGKFLLPGRETENVAIHLPKKLAYQVTPQADLQLGLKALEHLFFAAPPEQSTVALTFILTPPLAGAAGWRESDRYGLAIIGQTGTFKTRYCQGGMSLYGPDFMDDINLIRFGRETGATPKALQKYATYAYDAPILFDNYKPSLMPEKDFYALLHAVVESGEKDKLNRNSELRAAAPCYAWPIFTGEDLPDKDPASLARLLKINWTSGEAYQDRLTQAQTLAPHLCAVGNAWLSWLESDSGQVAAKAIAAKFPERRAFWVSRLRASEKDAQNVLRVASNLAINELAHEVMCHLDSPVGLLARSYFLPEAHQRGLEAIAQTMAYTTAASVEAVRFLEALSQLVTAAPEEKGYQALFTDVTLSQDDLGMGRDRTTYRNLIGWQSPDGIYLLGDKAREAVDRLLPENSLGKVSNAKLYEQLDSLGFLASKDEKGGKTQIVKKIAGKPCRVLHLKPEAMEPQV